MNNKNRILIGLTISGLLVVIIYLIISINELKKNIAINTDKTIINNVVNGFHTDLTTTFGDLENELAYVETANSFGSAISYLQKNQEVYFITASHNIGVNHNVNVLLANGNRYNALLVGKDEVLDIAVIKINVGFNVPVQKLGNSNILKMAEYVIASGAYHSREFLGSLSLGIVSDHHRQIIKRVNNENYYVDYIQSDLSSAKGMSGGPLFNMAKDVVGMNLLTGADDGTFSFSLPINEVKIVADQIIDGGKVNRNDFKIKGRAVSLIKIYERNELNIALNIAGGLYVKDVLDGGLASRVGIKDGDIIISINRQEINSIEDFRKMDYQNISKYNIEIIRNQKPMLLTGVDEK